MRRVDPRVDHGHTHRPEHRQGVPELERPDRAQVPLVGDERVGGLVGEHPAPADRLDVRDTGKLGELAGGLADGIDRDHDRPDVGQGLVHRAARGLADELGHALGVARIGDSDRDSAGRGVAGGGQDERGKERQKR